MLNEHRNHFYRKKEKRTFSSQSCLLNYKKNQIPTSIVLLAKNIDYTMNQTLQQFHITAQLGYFYLKNDMVRQISSHGMNCCNSTDFAGRLTTPAENLDPLPDFLWLWLSWSWLTRSSCQLWWILGSFQHFKIYGFISMAFMLLSSTWVSILNQPQNSDCFKVSWAGESNSVNSKSTEVFLQ